MSASNWSQDLLHDKICESMCVLFIEYGKSPQYFMGRQQTIDDDSSSN